ncbi:MAG: rod shape-determining protein MreD [Lysobacteraceae bacterium]|nr:MAG: rod shape-determining protein MreD [Xanthomonadaceae bacterium]
MSRRKPVGWAFFWSLLLAFVLTLVPLPDAIEWARPQLVALVIIYWSLEAPESIGMGTAFLIGIVHDVSVNSLVGQHALGFVIIAWIVGRFRLRLRFFPLWQQSLAVLAILFNDRVVGMWVNGLTGINFPGWQYWAAPLFGMLLWPWVFLAIDSMRFRR